MDKCGHLTYSPAYLVIDHGVFTAQIRFRHQTKAFDVLKKIYIRSIFEKLSFSITYGEKNSKK